MKDRLKFRIPEFKDNGTFKRFFYLELGGYIPGVLGGYSGDPQQCTGLKDNNGKLIYESDILISPDNDEPYRVMVKWSQEKARFIVAAWDGKDYVENLSDDTAESLQYFEVIGNIYENKELLE